MQDIRDSLFRDIRDKRFTAVLTPEANGLLSGVADAEAAAESLGLDWTCTVEEGGALRLGEPFARLTGTPKQLAMAEEQIIGTLSKPSGIATAARRAVEAANGKVRVVCGSWKKMPPAMKQAVRRAVVSGGASFRICEQPMIYIDKNYIRMLGSVPKALAACAALEGQTRVIQIRGDSASVREETNQAIAGGADVLMVDTGRREDLRACLGELARLGARDRVQVAFAGGVRLADVAEIAALGVNMLCIGRQIVDAALLDMRMDVTGEVDP